MPDTLGRQHLISKQDVSNIEKQFNVDGVAKHASDSDSVHVWVEELQSGDYKPVILYKVQGLKELTIEKVKHLRRISPYAFKLSCSVTLRDFEDSGFDCKL